MLRYIDKLEPGDKIKVTNFWYVRLRLFCETAFGKIFRKN